MSRPLRADHLLGLAAAVLTLAGLTLLVRRPSVSVPDVPPPSLAIPATPTAILASAPAAPAAIVRANVFSPTRTPPRTRYVPPGATPAASDGAVPDGEAEVAERPPLPRLDGTVIGASGATALIAIDPAAPAAQVYRVGDRAGAWRVVRIGDRSAVLDGPAGRVTLRLARPGARSPDPDRVVPMVLNESALSTATVPTPAAIGSAVSAAPREMPSDSIDACSHTTGRACS